MELFLAQLREKQGVACDHTINSDSRTQTQDSDTLTPNSIYTTQTAHQATEEAVTMLCSWGLRITEHPERTSCKLQQCDRGQIPRGVCTLCLQNQEWQSFLNHFSN